MASEDNRDTFSFSAAGWLQMYHFGVCKVLQDTGLANYQQLRFAGSSAGALASTAIIAKCDFDDVRAYSNECCRDARKSIWNALKIRKYVATGVQKFASEPFIKDTANLKARMEDQLEIYVTVLPWVRAKKMNKFDDVEDLVEALVASCCVTPLAGMPFPLRKTGEIVIDGGLAAFQPRAGEPNVITVSPMYFSTVDIKPSVYIPATWGLYPPDVESYDKLFDIGYNDALHFLVKTGRLPRRALSRLKNLEVQGSVYKSRYFTSPITSPLGSPATANKNGVVGGVTFATHTKDTSSSVVDIELCPDCQNERLIGDARHYVAFTPMPGSDVNATSVDKTRGDAKYYKCPSCGARHVGSSKGGSSQPALLSSGSQQKREAFFLFSLIDRGYKFSRRTIRSAKHAFRTVVLTAIDLSAITFFFIFIRLTALFVIYSEMLFATWIAFGFAFLQYLPFIGRRFRHPNPTALVPTEVKKYLYPGESTDEDEEDFDQGSFYGDTAEEEGGKSGGLIRSPSSHLRLRREMNDSATPEWGSNAYYDNAQQQYTTSRGKSKTSGNDSDDLGENVQAYMRKQKAKMREKARQLAKQQKSQQSQEGKEEGSTNTDAKNGGSNYDSYYEDPFSSDGNAMRNPSLHGLGTLQSPTVATSAEQLQQRRPTRRDTTRYTAALGTILAGYVTEVAGAEEDKSSNHSSPHKSTEGGETMEMARGVKRSSDIASATVPLTPSQALLKDLAEALTTIAADIITAEQEGSRVADMNAVIMNQWSMEHLAMAESRKRGEVENTSQAADKNSANGGRLADKRRLAAWAQMQKQFVERFLSSPQASTDLPERRDAITAVSLLMGASSFEDGFATRTAPGDDMPPQALLLSPTSPTATALRPAGVANKRMSQRACCQIAMQVAASRTMCLDLWESIQLILKKSDSLHILQNRSFDAQALSALIFRYPEPFGLAFAVSLETHRPAWVETYKCLTCIVPGTTISGEGLFRRSKSGSPQPSAKNRIGLQKQASKGSPSATKGGKPYRYRGAWKDLYEHIRNLLSLRVLLHLVVGEKVPVNVRRLYHRSTAYRLLQPYLASKKEKEEDDEE